MPGDYTRFPYQPRKRYSAVLMQQGRVQLDADSNEQAEILKRRIELLTMDIFGRCAVPISIPENVSAFEITVSSGDFLIGAGHMYVDGLLVENFERQLTSYWNQPFYFPDPDEAIPNEGMLFYLDVWEREVTHIQDRDLLEKALGGEDTATRIQTLWQVKTKRGSCEDPNFDRPSAGRLSSRALPAPAADDPCVISPSSGYRGLENRLYRVEIHDPGTVQGGITSARFKWSRENASIVSSVEAIALEGNQTQLTVSRIGRDKVLRFKIGDWVEILDDVRELMEQAGFMAKITNIDEANRRITVEAAVQGFDASDAARHTRLIRWDQQDGVDADGLVSVPAAGVWIKLEDGIEVRFALAASGGFRRSDYWIFAARTADGTVEELLVAPPRGIIHHYCALAARDAETLIDCRHRCAPCGDRVGTAPRADLSIEMGGAPGFEGRFVYTLTVQNNGPDRAENVIVNTTPSALPVTDSFLPAGMWTTTSGPTLVAELGDMETDAQVVLTFAVRPGTGQLTNSATVTSDTPDPEPENNEARFPLSNGVPGSPG